MAKIPGQRKSGQFGGDRHRSNKSAFRASGGQVRPPTKSCGLFIMMVAIPTLMSFAGGVYLGTILT